jgi:integrase
MTSKRGHGDGGIDARGENVWRLRYRVNGRRFTKTFRGSLSEARKELRGLIRSGDTGEHIAPDKITLAQWVDEWLTLKAAKRRHKTVERYRELLRLHVIPKLGARPLQQIETREINSLYLKLDETLAPRTRNHIHVVLKGCLTAAARNKLTVRNAAADADPPHPGDTEAGQVLDDNQLATLINGFKGSSIYEIVCVAAFTGMRRGEVLALRWSDLNETDKTLRIERALEYTRGHGLAFKPPKTKRGLRAITIDDGLIGLLHKEREKYQRIVVGVSSDAAVDLSLVKLPDTALIFPAPGGSLTAPRHPDAVTKQFMLRAGKLGFPGLRFHDLRGTHETHLLDKGHPVHTVAKRCGHDPAILLRVYAKRTKKSDTDAAATIGELTKGILN